MTGSPAHLLSIVLTRSWAVGLLGLGVAGGLIAVGWLDLVSTRREFTTLVEAQAVSIRDTVAAAARANRSAARAAEAELGQRLLDNARLLAELDRTGLLTPALLDRTAARNQLFRITVFAPDGSRERFVVPEGTGPGPGRGQGGPGWFAGVGAGAGPGAAQMVDALIHRRETELVTNLHAGRRTDVARLAAGVRRGNGGAIVVTVDASSVLRLEQQTSLEPLLDDIVDRSDDVAYLVFEQGDVRRTAGALPTSGPVAGVPHPEGEVSRRSLESAGRPIMELTGPIDLGAGDQAHLHLGMRLDRLRSAERRTQARLATTLTASATLGVVALGLVWLRRAYGALSAEHARAQEALRRQDRLAAMGELASTVAHEIRNPLNAIAMSAQRLSQEWPVAQFQTPDGDEEARALVRVVGTEAQRINEKVQQFLDFARPPRLAPQPTRVDSWVADIAHATSSLAASRGVELRVGDMPSTLVDLDPDQMRQVLDNVLRNAIDASPRGAAVDLRAALTDSHLVLSVADGGAGIPPEHLPRIFDLYFTTKADGTGVGLAIAHQIVVSHGGRIDVDSTPGHGTTMRIVLPVTLARDLHG